MGRVNPFLAQIPFYLLPLVAWDLPSLHEGLEKLRQVLEQGVNLSVLVRRYYTASQEQSQAPYILALVGHNHKELLHEVQRAFKGVGDAFNRKQEWKTPLGSYFTTNPLGPKGSIAFMYPGAFNSYPGLGKDLFTLFPACHDRLERFSSNPSLMVREQQLYPRSLEPITQRLLEFWEARLNEDMVAMMESGVSFAVLHTTILREYFRITPQAAFGYSLGETSMLYALGVWGSWESSYSNLRTSELFRTGLAGPKNLPRSLWGLPPSQEPAGEDFWSTYVLMAPAQLVRKRLRSETQVYLTHINTPEEVVIAGAGEACLKVIKDLGCEYFRSPASHVVHCTPVEPAYPELLNLCTQPVEAVLDIRFYCCASEEAPISLTNEALAPAIAQGICQFVDFPQLIERVWADGARIFIELGPGSTCSRWTSETLKGRDHLAVSINKRGTDDHTALVQLLAKLLSHRVALDLSLLYSTATEPPLKLSRTSVEPVPVPAPNPSRPPSLENLPPTTVSPSLPEQPQTELVKESAKADPVATPKMYILASQLLQEHAALVTRSHGIYLRERLKALHHLNELIRQQMFFAHKLVNQETQGEDQGQYDSENTDLTLQPSKRTREEKNQAPASSF
jgi:PfaB family protein